MQQDFARSRANMVENQVRTNDVTDLPVQDSMRVVERERFCAPARIDPSLGRRAAGRQCFVLGDGHGDALVVGHRARQRQLGRVHVHLGSQLVDVVIPVIV